MISELKDGLHVDGTTQQFLIVPQPLNMAGKESAEKIQRALRHKVRPTRVENLVNGDNVPAILAP